MRDPLRALVAHCIEIWIYVQYRDSCLMMKAAKATGIVEYPLNKVVL